MAPPHSHRPGSHRTVLSRITIKQPIAMTPTFILLNPELSLPKTAFEREQYHRGFVEGFIQSKAKGKAEAILIALDAWQIPVSEEDEARILAERDLATLDRWFDRILAARSTADLF